MRYGINGFLCSRKERFRCGLFILSESACQGHMQQLRQGLICSSCRHSCILWRQRSTASSSSCSSFRPNEKPHSRRRFCSAQSCSCKDHLTLKTSIDSAARQPCNSLDKAAECWAPLLCICTLCSTRWRHVLQESPLMQHSNGSAGQGPS